MNVELNQAYFWICPECGLDNYDRLLHMEMSPEEKDAMYEDLADEETTSLSVVRYPMEVTCIFCGNEYKTYGPHRDESEID